MNTFIRDNLLAWVKKEGVANAAEILDQPITDTQLIAWEARQPAADIMSAYVERVMVPGLVEKFTKERNEAIQMTMKEMAGSNLSLQKVLAPGSTSKDATDAVRAPAPAPAPVPVKAAPVGDSLGMVGVEPQTIIAAGSFDLKSYLASKPNLGAAELDELRKLFFGWEGRQVSLTTPFHKYTNPATCLNLVGFALDLGKDRMHMRLKTGDAQIHHTRSHLATDFLATGAQWALWVDDDMMIPFGRPDILRFYAQLPQSYPQRALEMHGIERLLSHKKSLVGACYYGRQPTGKAMFHEGKNDPEIDRRARTMPDVVLPTKWVGTGFMLVHRSVFLDIQKKFPELAPNPPGRPYWNFFQPMDDAGEDAAFCIRAAAAGHQPHVDLGLQCLHVGYACYGAHNTTPDFTKP